MNPKDSGSGTIAIAAYTPLSLQGYTLVA